MFISNKDNTILLQGLQTTDTILTSLYSVLITGHSQPKPIHGFLISNQSSLTLKRFFLPAAPLSLDPQVDQVPSPVALPCHISSNSNIAQVTLTAEGGWKSQQELAVPAG